jgi:hypothetical protein
MSQFWWLVLGITAHTLLVVLALAFALRAGYTRSQLITQTILAGLVPALGAIIVISMARDSIAVPPPPDSSRFDRNYTGEG